MTIAACSLYFPPGKSSWSNAVMIRAEVVISTEALVAHALWLVRRKNGQVLVRTLAAESPVIPVPHERRTVTVTLA